MVLLSLLIMLVIYILVINFIFTNVLYSPVFKLNLIYVAKLCLPLSCTVHFSSDKCTIQDMNSMKMIDLANQPDGLYMLILDSAHFDRISIDKACNFSFKSTL